MYSEYDMSRQTSTSFMVFAVVTQQLLLQNTDSDFWKGEFQIKELSTQFADMSKCNVYNF